MSKETDTQEESLEKALSPIVNRLIDKNYETSQDKIAMQMAPLIGGAIREQIKSQKDDVVDALYPVLGNMISRYVTKTLEDMLAKINTQIQEGLSSKSIKRKIQAKLQGVSESELLLNENASANIRALLLIHKETGIVLAHCENPNHRVSDPEMLASMMTAIRSFVNDWISQNSDSQELGEIEYGGNKIIIETSGYSYLAVIVEGSAYNATYNKIRQTLENIVLNHGDMIRKFNGDLNKFANIEIYKEISILLNSDKEEDKEKKKIHPLIFIIPFLFFLWGGYSYYKNYQNAALTKKVYSLFYATPQLTTYKLDVTADDGYVKLEGRVPFEYHKDLAQKLIQNIQGIKEVKNEIKLSSSLQDQMQISSNVAYLLKGFNTQEGANLTYSYNYQELTIKGSLWTQFQKDKLVEEINKIQHIQKVSFEVQINPPPLNKIIYFESTMSSLTPLAQKKLISAIETLKQLDDNYIIILSAYSDQIGTIQQNKLFSQKRISSIISFLQYQGKLTNKFTSIIYDTPPAGLDMTKELDKARYVRISYKKKEI